MVEIVVWPCALLIPEECKAHPAPFTRSGGLTLGGTKPSVRTDLGYWKIDLLKVPMKSVEQRRTWDAIDTYLGGTSGRIAVPAWSMDTAPFASGVEERLIDVLHDDDTPFDDDTPYSQNAIAVESVGVTAVGATVISMRLINGASSLSGVRFSYNHALYKTGQVVSIVDDVWTLRIAPSVRQLIPAGADLEFDRPTCVCNLAEEDGLSRSINSNRMEYLDVSFIEDTKFWSDLALGLI